MDRRYDTNQSRKSERLLPGWTIMIPIFFVLLTVGGMAWMLADYNTYGGIGPNGIYSEGSIEATSEPTAALDGPVIIAGQHGVVSAKPGVASRDIEAAPVVEAKPLGVVVETTGDASATGAANQGDSQQVVMAQMPGSVKTVEAMLTTPTQALITKPVELDRVKVIEVVGDKGFYVKPMTGDVSKSVFVRLDQQATPSREGIEGRYDVNAGDIIQISGTIKAVKSEESIMEMDSMIERDELDKYADDRVYIHADKLFGVEETVPSARQKMY